jgi:hypothetical protein
MPSKRQATPRPRRHWHLQFRGRFALLFWFLLGSITFYPYAETSGLGYYLFRIVGAAIILLTVYAVTFRRGLLLLVVALAIPSIVQHLFLHPHSPGVWRLIDRILSLAFDLLIIGIIGRHIFERETPDSECIFGALCIYLMLGFSFAGVYTAIDTAHPDAFYLTPALNIHDTPDRFDFIYFSFGTLTELGTPGINAVAPVARSVSLLEAIVGVLYLAVLISRLINAYRAEELLGEAPRGQIDPPIDESR